MKNIKYIIIGILGFISTSCVKDLMEEINSGAWNNERSVLDVKFTNQLGAPVISRDDQGNGQISFFYYDTLNINDLDLKVERINLSFGATSDKKIGDVVSFVGDSVASIIVTSQSGQTKEWTIRLKVFEDPIIGSWSIKSLWIYGGMWPQYGGTQLLDMSKIAELQKFSLPPAKEIDNILTFTLDGVSSLGDPFGTVENKAGADESYADFVWQTSDTLADVNQFYRKIPKGISKWSKNMGKRQITFTTLDGLKSETCTFHDAKSIILDVNKTIVIEDNAFQFDILKPDYRKTLYVRRNIVVDSPKKYFIKIQKIN